MRFPLFRNFLEIVQLDLSLTFFDFSGIIPSYGKTKKFPLCGYIVDSTHSYNHTFLATILALIAAFGLIWVVYPRKTRKSPTVKYNY